MWSPENKERNKKIMQMIKDHSIGEIAKEFGISTQRVHQIVNEHGGYPVGRLQHQRGNMLRAMRSGLIEKLGKSSDAELAREFQVTDTSVRIARTKRGIRKFLSNPVVDGKRRCHKCKRMVELKDLIKDKTISCGYQPKCKKCMREYAEEHRHAKSSLRP